MKFREKTRKITLRDSSITIGGTNNVIIQFMCNTKTSDVKATVASKIKALEEVKLPSS